VPNVTSAAPTDMPTGTLVTVVVVPSDLVIFAVAEMYVAPAEKLLTALKMIEAVPVLSVKAVAAVGVNATSELSDAEKVTIAPLTRLPLASLSTAVIFTGCPNVTVEGTVKTREATAVVVVLLPVPVPSSLLPPQAIRQQSKIKEISKHNDRNNLALIDFVILLPFLKRYIKYVMFIFNFTRNVIVFQHFFYSLGLFIR
jgi:hypothetical protein